MHRTLLSKFERIIVMVLLGLMALAVLGATIELVVVFAKQFLKPPGFIIDLDKLLDIFGSLLMVVIGLELLETMKAYLDKDRMHVEVVFLVALVAVARKIIIVDYKTVAPEMLYAVSAVVVALGVSYFLVRRALNMPPPSDKDRRPPAP